MTFFYDSTLVHVKCFCFWIIAVLNEGFRFARYFYLLCSPVIPFVVFYLKVHRNEIDM